MFVQSDWRETLTAARAGSAPAANHLAESLFEWTQLELIMRDVRDREDIACAFVEHMIRDDFTHLPDLEPARLHAFLAKCLTNFVISWRRREQRHELLQIPFSQLQDTEDEDEEGL